MENDNKRLHEWFGKHWHTMKPDGKTCADCGAYGNLVAQHNPDYSTESGFFALLSGLEKKRLMVTLMDWYYYEKLTFTAKIRTFAINAVEFEARADTLPEALFQAAIKAMTSEEKAD